MNCRCASEWIEKLRLVAHPEGGYYRETYRSSLLIEASALGVSSGFGGARNASTAIYFLLNQKEHSAFHRIRSDELWHFHDGETLAIYAIHPDGILTTHRLGLDVDAGDSPQVVIPAGCWFGAALVDDTAFCLCSCTVSPGFDFADFELAAPDDLASEFPAHDALIHRLHAK